MGEKISKINEIERLTQRPEAKTFADVAGELKQALFSTIQAQKEHLVESQRKFFEGVQEDLNGALGYLEGIGNSLRRPTLVATELVLAFKVLTACAPVSPTKPTESPQNTTAPRYTEVAPTATFIPNITATEVPTIEATKVPEIEKFNICTPEKFRDCFFPPEALLPPKPGELPPLVKYLKTLDWPAYDESKLKFDKLEDDGPNDGIIYEVKTKPHYLDPATRPFRKDSVAGWTTYEGIDYFVVAVQYYVKGMDPKDYPWIIGVSPNTTDYKKFDQACIENWAYMDFPAWNPEDSYPLVVKSFDSDPDSNMSKRIDAFKAGDPTALDGALLETHVLKEVSGNWLK